MIIIPMSRPQIAPISKDGMKTPDDTMSPYVHVASRWYTISNTISGTNSHSSVKRTSLWQFCFNVVNSRHFNNGESKGGVRDACPPPWVQILSFSCSFREKFD